MTKLNNLAVTLSPSWWPTFEPGLLSQAELARRPSRRRRDGERRRCRPAPQAPFPLGPQARAVCPGFLVLLTSYPRQKATNYLFLYLKTT